MKLIASSRKAWLVIWLMWGFCVASMAQPGTAESGASAPTSGAALASAPTTSPPTTQPASQPASPPVEAEHRWAAIPRVFGRLKASDVGVVINTDDPYSVQVGEYYIKARQIQPAHVLRLSFPVKPALTRSEFGPLYQRIQGAFGPEVQALALAWRFPYAVECNSITGALTLGFDPQLCVKTCAVSRSSPYFGSASVKPFSDYGMRLTMLLAARDVDEAESLIDRGVRSDDTLGRKGAPPVNVHFVTTSDAVRSRRQILFPPQGLVPAFGVDVHLDHTDALRDADRVVMYLTGKERVKALDSVHFVPGAIADHLTSFGGMLDDAHGQMSVLSWIDAGVTATYGTTSEPCAHLQKFPHPQALLLFYLSGATAIEAYWKSVRWPQQGLFVGEPLAAPFARN